jgi:hypothetical protein
VRWSVLPPAVVRLFPCGPAGQPDGRGASARRGHLRASPGFRSPSRGDHPPTSLRQGEAAPRRPGAFPGELAGAEHLPVTPPTGPELKQHLVDQPLEGFIPCRGVGEVPSKHRVHDLDERPPRPRRSLPHREQVVVTPRTLLALRSPTHDAQFHTLPARVAKHPRPAARGPSISIGVSRSGPGPPADGDQQVERVTTPRTISDQALGRVMGFLAPVSQCPLRRAPRIAGLPHGEPACLRHDLGSRPDG